MSFNRRGFLQSASAVLAANVSDDVVAEEIDRGEPRLWRVQAAPTPQGTPTCSVLMPSGLKLDPSGRIIDFANVYEMLIVPAVRDAGFQIARAREPESGERASRQIFDRLL